MMIKYEMFANAKQLAEKHLGKRIRNTREDAKSKVGIISGWTSNNQSVIYEPETPDIGYRVKYVENAETHHFLRSIKRYFVFDIGRFGRDILLEEGPDDCLDCGARGIDPCKVWCPNKEK